MASEEIDSEKREIGLNLKGARKNAGMTLVQVGKKFGVSKQVVSAWELGRGDPGLVRLRRLAKLYNVSADALLWANAPSLEAMQIAAQYDALNEDQKKRLRAVWMAFVDLVASNETVENRMPITKRLPEPQGNDHA